MKKLLRCVLALCMIATIAGCSNKPADTNISDGVYTESAKGNNGAVSYTHLMMSVMYCWLLTRISLSIP